MGSVVMGADLRLLSVSLLILAWPSAALGADRKAPRELGTPLTLIQEGRLAGSPDTSEEARPLPEEEPAPDETPPDETPPDQPPSDETPEEPEEEALAPGDASVGTSGGAEGSAVAPEGPERDPLTGRFRLTARGMIVIMAAWGSQRLTPGQYALWVSQPAFQGAQFQLSPANTTVGFSLEGVSFHDWKISGALDLTLKSPSPANRTILAPLFYDIHIAAVRKNVYLLIGQFPDVILPFAPASTNGFPGSYIPGQIGFYRPQLRAGTKIDLNEAFDLRLQGSIGRDIQNFEVSPLVIGAGAGYPDLQGRVSVGAGRDTKEAAAPWKRAYEVGVAGHWGGRTFGLVTDDEVTLAKRNTWSVVADARAELTTGTLLRGRVWTGRTLQDYAAASFQSINAALESIDASGFWIDLRQRFGPSWTASLGYGRDDPVDADLDPGQRALSESAFLNAYWHWSRRVSFAAQLSWWHTDWKAVGDPEVWRGEVLTAIRY